MTYMLASDWWRKKGVRKAGWEHVHKVIYIPGKGLEREPSGNRKGRHREPEVTSSNMADGGHVVFGGKLRTRREKGSRTQMGQRDAILKKSQFFNPDIVSLVTSGNVDTRTLMVKMSKVLQSPKSNPGTAWGSRSRWQKKEAQSPNGGLHGGLDPSEKEEVL